jgi:hypothetical protein
VAFTFILLLTNTTNLNEADVARKIKQYKPIKFGDGPDPDTVEGHRNKMIEAAETRPITEG